MKDIKLGQFVNIIGIDLRMTVIGIEYPRDINLAYFHNDALHMVSRIDCRALEPYADTISK